MSFVTVNNITFYKEFPIFFQYESMFISSSKMTANFHLCWCDV